MIGLSFQTDANEDGITDHQGGEEGTKPGGVHLRVTTALRKYMKIHKTNPIRKY